MTTTHEARFTKLPINNIPWSPIHPKSSSWYMQAFIIVNSNLSHIFISSSCWEWVGGFNFGNWTIIQTCEWNIGVSTDGSMGLPVVNSACSIMELPLVSCLYYIYIIHVYCVHKCIKLYTCVCMCLIRVSEDVQAGRARIVRQINGHTVDGSATRYTAASGYTNPVLTPLHPEIDNVCAGVLHLRWQL